MIHCLGQILSVLYMIITVIGWTVVTVNRISLSKLRRRDLEDQDLNLYKKQHLRDDDGRIIGTRNLGDPIHLWSHSRRRAERRFMNSLCFMIPFTLSSASSWLHLPAVSF